MHPHAKLLEAEIYNEPQGKFTDSGKNVALTPDFSLPQCSTLISDIDHQDFFWKSETSVATVPRSIQNSSWTSAENAEVCMVGTMLLHTSFGYLCHCGFLNVRFPNDRSSNNKDAFLRNKAKTSLNML